MKIQYLGEREEVDLFLLLHLVCWLVLLDERLPLPFLPALDFNHLQGDEDFRRTGCLARNSTKYILL